MITNPDIVPVVADIIRAIGDKGEIKATTDKLFKIKFNNPVPRARVCVRVCARARVCTARARVCVRAHVRVCEHVRRANTNKPVWSVFVSVILQTKLQLPSTTTITTAPVGHLPTTD